MPSCANGVTVRMAAMDSLNTSRSSRASTLTSSRRRRPRRRRDGARDARRARRRRRRGDEARGRDATRARPRATRVAAVVHVQSRSPLGTARAFSPRSHRGRRRRVARGGRARGASRRRRRRRERRRHGDDRDARVCGSMDDGGALSSTPRGIRARAARWTSRDGVRDAIRSRVRRVVSEDVDAVGDVARERGLRSGIDFAALVREDETPSRTRGCARKGSCARMTRNARRCGCWMTRASERRRREASVGGGGSAAAAGGRSADGSGAVVGARSRAGRRRARLSSPGAVGRTCGGPGSGKTFVMVISRHASRDGGRGKREHFHSFMLATHPVHK